MSPTERGSTRRADRSERRLPSALRSAARCWQRWGERDPLYAVLTHPDKRHNRWDIDAFLETGRAQIEDDLSWAADVGCDLGSLRALDFGCGVGRLTLALASRYEHVDGVDVAPSMLRLASTTVTSDRCRFHLNRSADLSLFEDGTFDLVYSSLVLQHLDPALARAYVAEFVRVVRPGGSIVFQIATAARLHSRRSPIRRLAGVVRSATRRSDAIPMHVTPATEVCRWVDAAGGRVLATRSGPMDFVYDQMLVAAERPTS